MTWTNGRDARLDFDGTPLGQVIRLGKGTRGFCAANASARYVRLPSTFSNHSLRSELLPAFVNGGAEPAA